MKQINTIVIVSIIVILFSCSQEVITNENPETTTVDSQTGSVSITIKGAATMTRAVGDVTQLIIKLNHEKYPSIQKHADYTGTYTTDTVSTLTINNIKTGTWELQAYLENASNQIEFYGETTIEITPATTTNAKVYLEEAGSVNAQLIIGNGPRHVETFVYNEDSLNNVYYDGEYLRAFSSIVGTYKIDPVSGALLDTFYSTYYDYITYDGVYVWKLSYETLYKTDKQSGTVIESFDIFTDSLGGTLGMTFDGEYLWIIRNENKTIYKIDPQTGSTVLSFVIDAMTVEEICFVGTDLLVSTDNSLMSIDKTTGSVISTFAMDHWSHGLAFDGKYLYSSCGEKIYKYEYVTDESPTSTISGIISNSNGNPVVNAAVHITSFSENHVVKKSAVTDSTGRYELSVPVLTGTLSVYHEDYDLYTQEITIAGTGTYNAVISPGILAAPTDLTTDVSDINGSQIALSWTPINSDAVKGYNIYRAPYSPYDFVIVNTEPIAGSTWIDTYNLQSDVVYYYKIATVNTDDEEGPPSGYTQTSTLQGYIDTLAIPATSPYGLDFDGTYFWVSDDGTDKIYRINPETGSALELASPTSNIDGLAINGNDLWVFDSLYYDLYKLNATDGSLISTLNDIGYMSEGRLVFLNDYIYIYSESGIIYKLDPLTGSIIASRTVLNDYIYNTNGITTDGTSLFYFDQTQNSIVQFNPYTLTEIQRFSYSPQYQDITFDGEYFWGLTSSEIRKFKLPIDTGTSTIGDYSLSGYIVDASGDPITDVTVDVVSFATSPVFKLSVAVDDLGFYQLQVPSGINHVEYRHADYQIRREDLEINGSKQYSIILVP